MRAHEDLGSPLFPFRSLELRDDLSPQYLSRCIRDAARYTSSRKDSLAPDKRPHVRDDADPSYSKLRGISRYARNMSQVTRILSQIEAGDPTAAEQLLPLVYDELRKLAAARLAQEKPGQTLQPTALVHEAYLRLVDVEQAQSWHGRGHFFGAAAEAMRRILLNRARDKGRIKRGGRLRKVDLEQAELAINTPHEQLVAIDEAIERLAAETPVCGQLVKLRFFVGLTLEETAAAMNISLSTAKRYWAYARAWLFDALGADDHASTSENSKKSPNS